MKKNYEAKELHTPVMLNEVVELAPKGYGKIVLDCTFGIGGHSFSIVEDLKKSTVLGIDVDEESIDMSVDIARDIGWEVVGTASEEIGGWKMVDSKKNILYLVKWNFDDLLTILGKLDINRVDFVLFDLGFSTFQLKRTKRGFSYAGEEEILDQRYDVTSGWRACDLVNMCSARELEILFRRYGEEKRAEAIAKAIASARKIKPIETNRELSNIIRKAVGKGKLGRSAEWRDEKHPAMKVFQALRIAVNNEIFSLATALPQAFKHLVAGCGRIIVITFNSIERQLVEKFIANRKDSVLELKKTPSFGEVAKNPSSRSAVMYVIAKR